MQNKTKNNHFSILRKRKMLNRIELPWNVYFIYTPEDDVIN